MIYWIIFIVIGFVMGTFALQVNDTSKWSTLRVVVVFWSNFILAIPLLIYCIIAGVLKGLRR